MTLADLFHDAAEFVALEPEDAAAAILVDAQRRVSLHRQSWPQWPVFLRAALPYATHSSGDSPAWPLAGQQAVEHALAEAVGWLKREGLVMDGLVGTQAGPGKLVFTRRGLQLRTKADVARYREASALPRTLVHLSISEQVVPLFLRGSRDSAISYAFREVEIAVRRAAGYGAEKHGMAMMRDAFNPTNGSLADQTLPYGERDAEQALFAGAIGHGRNPVNHRGMDMEPVEAARLILLASHLLSLVEKRRPQQEALDTCGSALAP